MEQAFINDDDALPTLQWQRHASTQTHTQQPYRFLGIQLMRICCESRTFPRGLNINRSK